MPPRRSSRAVSASVDPPPAAESLPTKRKRGQTIDPDSEAKENLPKPPPKTRRSSSARASVAPAPKGRSSTRSKASLPDVPESDDDDESETPPVKKSRPSAERAVKEEEGESGSAARETSRRRPATSKRNEDTSMEVDEDVKAPKRRAASRQASAPSGRRSNAAPPTRAVRSSRVVSAAVSAEEEEEDEKPKKTRAGRVSARASVKLQPESDDEAEPIPQPASDSEDEEFEKRPSKGRKPRGPPARKPRAPPKKSARTAVIDDSDDDQLEPPPPAQPQSSRTHSDDGLNVADASAEASQPEEEKEEEEEEKSLFDPPPMPTASSLPQTMPEEPQGPKARLVIHKMALVNFKSYAGRQEIGPFHKSFSSIVGPNGSGKSNTIDALLFVFGYRASKMRQGKVSELIHNSARYPDLDECSVEVHFREIIDLPGPDAYEVVPESKLVVTRSAFKNNQSKYTIDGKTAMYKEVQTLLKGRGIDLDHNRFLILQGEVESIAQMKPKAPSEHEDGLLEYLEDIIGTSKYKEPIDEALVEMEKLQDERQVKMNRLRLVEKEKSALEDKKREAIGFLKMKNDHVRALSRLWQWYIWKILETQDGLEHTIERIKAELEKETNNNKDDITHLEMLKKHYEEREKTYEDVRAAATEAIKDLKEKEKNVVGLQERQKHASSRSKKLKKSVQEATVSLRDATRGIEANTQKIENEKAKVAEHEASLVEEEKILDGIQESLRGKTQVFHDQIQVKQNDLQPWTAKINAKQAEIDVAQGERDALAKKAEAIKAASKEAEETLQTLESEQAAKLEEQSQHRVKKDRLKQDLANATKRVQDAQRDLADWRSKASTSRNKVEEAKANQSANRSQGAVLDALTKLKATGRLHGFHGKLGSLGTIPDKYDVAISTACGGGLSNMVVDTVDQGKACLDYLRQHNTGRASIMILDKIPSRSLAPVQTPENVPRLFDLVKVKDAMYAPAFYKAIGDTLVADDLEQANRIAFGGHRRWRVVTLAGQVIEVSGAMSGGGGQPMKGSMSSKLAAETVRPEVLRDYERDSDQCAQQLQKAIAEAQAAEVEFEQLQRAGPELDMTLQKLSLEIETRKTRISEASKRIKDLRSQSKPDAGDIARIAKLDSEIAKAASSLEKLQQESTKISNSIKELEQKIMDIGGSRLLAQKSKVKGIHLHIKLAGDEVTKAEVAIAKAEKDIKKFTVSLEADTAALNDVNAELAELNQQLESVDEYLTELRTKVEDAQSAADQEKEDLKKLKTKVDKKDEQIAKFRKKEMELKQQLGDAQKDYDVGEKQIETLQHDHDTLKLENIDDEDEDDSDEEEGDTEETADGDVKQDPDEAEGPSKKRSVTKLRAYGAEELRRFKKQELIADSELLDEKIKNAKVDLTVLKEYKQREAELDNRVKDLETVTKQRDEQKAVYDGLRKQRLDEFMAGFNLISLKLKEMYQMITLGGNAELELVDSMDPFAEGIIFSVMPPKKSWKNISNLSGGEKTLSSLALVFALHVFKPTPLYFMDEIDAALDFRNVSIVANYIKDRTKNAQFIIISLRNDMFELSHRLIGIYKTANATRSISINNHALISSIPPPTNATA